MKIPDGKCGATIPGGEDGVHVGDGSARSQDTVSALKMCCYKHHNYLNMCGEKRLLTSKKKSLSIKSIVIARKLTAGTTLSFHCFK